MKEKLKSYLEPNQKIRTAETIVLVMLLLGSLFSYVRGTASLYKDPGELTYIETTALARDFEAEDYDEDSTSCDVIFANEEGQLIKTYTYEEYEELKDESIDAYVYETDDGIKLFFDHKDPNPDVIKGVYRQTMATALMPVFNLANALIILVLGLDIGMEDLESLGQYAAAAGFLMLTVTMLLYDRVLTNLEILYERRLRGKLKRFLT